MPLELVLSAGFCLAMLALRYRLSKPLKLPPATVQQRMKLAKILVTAAIAMAAIGYRLQRSSHELGAKGAYEPSLWERIVLTLDR